MQITADFYSPDEAAAAAGAIRSRLDNVADIIIYDRSGRGGSSFIPAVFPVFNTMGGNPSYSLPPVIMKAAADSSRRNIYPIKVICREADGKTASHILVNKGGHNITQTM